MRDISIDSNALCILSRSQCITFLSMFYLFIEYYLESITNALNGLSTGTRQKYINRKNAIKSSKNTR